MKTVAAETLSGHDRLVARSRALHRAVAEKIRSRPELMAVARENLDHWIAQEEQHGRVSRGLLDWKRIFETHTTEQILNLLCEQTEEADRLRHATPFCGILTEPEREAIYRHYAALPA